MVPETLEVVPGLTPRLIDTELPGYEAAQMQIPPLSKYQKLDPFKKTLKGLSNISHRLNS